MTRARLSHRRLHVAPRRLCQGGYTMTVVTEMDGSL